MSETPKPETEQPPTPDTLHDVALAAWHNNADAVKEDSLPYGGQSLVLYPTGSPRDKITIFPVSGHTDMEDGTFRMIRSKGGSIIGALDVRTNEDGQRWVTSLWGSDIPGALEPVHVEEDMIARMQREIGEASATRPIGRIAKLLGKITTPKIK